MRNARQKLTIQGDIAMFFAANFETAQANEVRRVRPNGVRTSRRPYFGPRPSPVSGDHAAAVFVPVEDEALREPQAFMVELSEGNPLPVHFHFVDQFQVVLAGGGDFGGHTVESVAVHFAGAATGYGPIIPGPDGIRFLTLRARPDSTGSQALPALLHKMPKRKRHNVYVNELMKGLGQFGPLGDAPQTILFLQQDDGLAVSLLRLPAGASVRHSVPAACDGQTLVVLEGSVDCRGANWERWSVMYLSTNEAALDLQAGPEGAQILVLQYPVPSP
jgi:hypothetical protein